MCLGLALNMAVLHARPAGAQPASVLRPIHLDPSSCEATPFGDVAAILRVELYNRLVEGPPRQDAYRAALDCAGSIVVVSVTVPGGTTRSFRTDLGGTPANVRARVVGLGVAELVRELDREPALPPPAPRPPPPPARVPDEPSPPLHADRDRRVVDLGAFAQTSSFELDGAWLAGGGLRFDYADRRFAAGLDVALLTMTDRFEPGTTQVLLAYGSPYAAWRERWGPVQTRLGGGYALGAARIRGHATDATAFAGTTTGPWSAPYAFAALRLMLTDDLSVDARGQLGWVTSEVIGQVAGASDVALEGAWATVQLGIAITL